MWASPVGGRLGVRRERDHRKENSILTLQYRGRQGPANSPSPSPQPTARARAHSPQPSPKRLLFLAQILTLLDDFDEILPSLSPFCTENLVFAQILTLLSHFSQILTSLDLYSTILTKSLSYSALAKLRALAFI